MRKEIKKDIFHLILVVVASLIMAVNIKNFVNAGSLFPGGFTGLAVLIQRICQKYFGIVVPFSPVNLLLNAVPAIISFKFIGKKFTILSCLSIVLTSVFTDALPSVPLTYDILLISIFGGILMGAGISICLQAEATSGGTDFIAMFLSQRFGIDAFNYIFIGNVVMLLIAGAIFGWDSALYSIIFQFTSTEVVHMFYKRYKKNTLFIITDYPDEVAEIIYRIARHGATKMQATGTYSNRERFIIYSVVGNDEIKKIISEIQRVDENAFVNVLKTEQLDGNFYIPPTE
ncbi:YitT family protein [bacterium C-53]|nr:YitT family protein [Lachnospiraceae bacterium]NBI04757.1 YitT family protein [Lachnospiraceae bacterium]RKJ07829.1 YitT family protein [bacterium C-53]